MPHVKAAARSWYQQDKLRNIANEAKASDFLNFLVQEIIKGRKSKTFMVSFRDFEHPLLTRLYAARLLHPMKTIWSHPDKPGEPYRLVTMDYGCYLDLRGTRSEPHQLAFWDTSEQVEGVDDLSPVG